MYIITAKDSNSSEQVVIHDSSSNDRDYALVSGTLRVEFNKSGSLSFSVPPNNYAYTTGILKRMKTRITVYKKKNSAWEFLWSGRILDVNKNFFGQMTYNCEGWLGSLNDSVVTPDLQVTVDGKNVKADKDKGVDALPYEYFNALIKAHNSQVGSDKSLTPDFDRSVNKKVNFPIGEYETTFDCIMNNLIGNADAGGRIWISGNTIYYRSDEWYSADSDRDMGGQPVIFGENLLDYSETVDATEVYTVIVPIGKDGLKIKHGGKVTTGSDGKKTLVDSGKDYIEWEDATNTYGRIVHYEEFSDISKETDLKNKAYTTIEERQISATTIELSAFDLALLNPDLDMLKVGERIRIVSQPHMLDMSGYLCTSAEIDLVNPANTKYIIGINPDTLTAKQVKYLKQFKNVSDKYTKYGVEVRLRGNDGYDNLLRLDIDTLDNYRLA